MRAGVGVLILFQLWGVWTAASYSSSPGLNFFTALTIANLVIISLFASAVFANAILEEKEEQTLPLLRMADIGPLSLLLGKWLPRLVMAILLLVIQLPFAILSITLGGVLWSQVYASFWMLLAYLFFVGNIGLFFSVWCHRIGTAYGLTVGTLFLLEIAIPQFAQVVSAASTNAVASSVADGIHGWLNEINCISRAEAIFSVGFAEESFDRFFWGNIAAGGAVFLLTWLTFDRATAREPSHRPWWSDLLKGTRRSSSTAPGRRRASPASGSSSAEDVSRTGLAPSPYAARETVLPSGRRSWDAALAYKDFHQIAGGPLFLMIRLVVAAVTVFGTVGMILYASGSLSPGDLIEFVGGTSLGWGIFFFILEAGALFARVMRAEIKDRTWATLVLLPKSIPEIMFSKLAGAGMALLPWLSMIAFGAMATAHNWIGEFRHAGFAGAMFWFCCQVLLGIQLAMYFGLVFDFAIWPLAVGMAAMAVIVANTMIVSCFIGAVGGGSGGPEVFMGMMGIGAIVLTAVFFQLSVARLEELAADEK